MIALSKKHFLLIALSLAAIISSCSDQPEKKEVENPEAAIQVKKEAYSFVVKDFDPDQIWPYNISGSWGYFSNDNEFVIKPVFNACGFFSEGFSWVQQERLMKIINSSGKFVNEYESFHQVGKTKNGLIPVKNSDYWGIVDTTGTRIIPFEYTEIEILDDSLIAVQENSKWGLVNYDGKKLCLPVYKQIKFDGAFAEVKRNYQDVGLLNKKGEEVVACKYASVQSINDSTFILTKEQGYHTYYGLQQGDAIKLALEFSRIESYQDSLLVLTRNDSSGIINLRGDTILSPYYNDLKVGNTNYIAAKGDGKWGYINLARDTLIKFQFREVAPFQGQSAIVYGENFDKYNSPPDRSGLINYKGDFIIPIESRRLKFISNEVLLSEPNNWRVKLYNSDGEMIDSIDFDKEQLNTKRDEYNGDIYKPINFYEFVNGFAIVGRKGKIGMINTMGEIVIPLQYHHLEPMNEYGFTKAQYLNKYGIINSKGEVIVPIGYEHIGYDETYGVFYLQEESPESKSYKDKYENVGYFKYDGTLLSNSLLKKPSVYDLEAHIKAIRAAYNKIQQDTKGKKLNKILLEDSSVYAQYDNQKVVVTDDKTATRYEYYYDSRLNKFGPFFIFKVSPAGENRYYFDQGRIIQWLNKNQEEDFISDAIWSPEHEEHYQARAFKAQIENKELIKKHNLKALKKEIDDLCELIALNISKGIYKKGDSESTSAGIYQRREEVYVDSLKNTMYELKAISDEGGSSKNESYYYNGQLIRKYSDYHYTDNRNNIMEAQWPSGRYAVTEYYEEGELKFSEKESNAVITLSLKKQY